MGKRFSRLAFVFFLCFGSSECLRAGTRAAATRSPVKKLPAASMITGPADRIQQAAGGEPGMIFRLTPRKDYPGGSYNTAAYMQEDISGQTLTLRSVPARVYLELQLSDWGSAPSGNGYVAVWETYVDASSYASGVGGELTLADQPCADSSDCGASFGIPEQSGSCESGKCLFAWIDYLRSDGIQTTVPCSFNFWLVGHLKNPMGHKYFGVTESGHGGVHCGVADPGTIQYAGTFALDVPLDAAGNYTIALQPPPKFTFAADDEHEEITVAALLPAVIVVPCESDTECDDGNPCTGESCIAAVCSYGFLAAGVSCGSPTTDACEEGPVCDGAGVCGKSLKPAGSVCREALDDCDVEEVCDGISIDCPPDVIHPDGAACAGDGEACTGDWCLAAKCVSLDDCGCTTEEVCGDGCCLSGFERVSSCASDCADLHDVADLQVCLGVEAPGNSACASFDVDSDEWITLLDYHAYVQRYFGGP